MTKRQFIVKEIKKNLVPALKEYLFKGHSKSDAFCFNRYDKIEAVKDSFFFNFTSYFSIPLLEKRFDKVHNIIDPIIGVYYKDYENNLWENTIRFTPKLSDSDVEFDNMSNIFDDLEDMQFKVGQLKNYIIKKGLPMYEKFNDLVYVDQFITKLKNEDKSKFYTFLGCVDFYQFHSFKRMTIARIVNNPAYECICNEELDFLKMLVATDVNEPQYKYLFNIYDDLKLFLDKL
jgi:hypothetical protein